MINFRDVAILTTRTALSNKTMLCVVLLLGLQTGCAFFPSLHAGVGSRTTCQLPPDEFARVEMLAQNAWAECVSRNPKLAASNYYEQGFRDGFIDRLTSKYSRTWKSGYRHGTWLAIRQGIPPLSTTLEPTPLSCSSLAGPTPIESVTSEDPFRPHQATPSALPTPAAPPMNSIDSLELEPQIEYDFDPQRGIIDAPSEIEVEPTTAAPYEESPPSNVIDAPRHPQPDAPTNDAGSPNWKTDQGAPPANPRRQPESDDLFPSDGEDNQPLNDDFEDDLDLLSPFGNQVPPNEANKPQPNLESGENSSESNAEDLDFSGDSSDGNSEGFEFQIHDQSELEETEADDDARAWLDDEPPTDRRAATVPTRSFFERAVSSTADKQPGQTATNEADGLDTAVGSVQPASFFATATSNPTKRDGGLSGELLQIPLKKKVWYFDQSSADSPTP